MAGDGNSSDKPSKGFLADNANAIALAGFLGVAGLLWALVGGGVEGWVDSRIEAHPQVRAAVEIQVKVTALEAEMRTQNKLLLRLLPPPPGD